MDQKIKVVFLAPTQMEIEKCLPHLKTQTHIAVEISGVGMYKTAFKTAECIEKYKPDAMVLIGIAGAYPDSGLSVGEVVKVGREYTADMGSFINGIFNDKFKELHGKGVIKWYNGDHDDIKLVDSNTVNCAGFPHADTRQAKIENMEGAAFFYVCGQKRVRASEFRAVCNFVGDDLPEWDIEKATTNLAATLAKYRF